MNDRIELRNIFTRNLSEILKSITTQISKENFDIVEDLIENREFEVACDWILSSLPASETPEVRDAKDKISLLMQKIGLR